jgi:hypothetical protein
MILRLLSFGCLFAFGITLTACSCSVDPLTVERQECWSHTYYVNGADKIDDIPCPNE